MKKSAYLFTLALLSIATVFAQKSNIEKDIQMYTQVWDEVINQGKTELINSTHFDENVKLITAPENVVGIAALKSYWDTFLTGFSDVKFTIKDIFGQDDKLVKHWHFSGKHTGDFFGIPASGNTISSEGTTLIKMKNGKIAQEQDFFDVTNLIKQMGYDPNQGNVAIVDQLYKAFAIGDIPSVLGAMDPKIVWNESSCSSFANGNPYTSPESVLNGVFKRIGEDSENFKLENIKLVAMDGNKVLALLNYNFKSKKTGENIITTVVHEWTIENGKITAFQQYLGLGKQ